MPIRFEELGQEGLVEFATSADGTRIAFQRQGAGEAVLFVHGTMASNEAWALVAALLSERFTVVAMDRRGHGRSEPGPSHSTRREAEDVVAVIDAVGQPAHLVGHSGGARVALAVPHRTDRLLSMVLYEPAIAVRHSPADLPDRADALIRAGDREAAVETFLREAACLPDEEIAILRSLPPVWEQACADAANGPRDIRTFIAEPIELGVLHSITVPTLVLVGGDQDAPIYLDGLDEITSAIPHATRQVIPRQGHLANVLAPDVFAETLTSFFDGLSR
jgi:pimeloyl-ACP methyl ester carboxylesterase